MNNLIELRNVTFGFNHQVVLEDVNLSITQNDYLLMIGPNGGGKTTLLKLILGLYRPVSGTIAFRDGVRGRIGYVPQFSTFSRDFPQTVLGLVLLGTIDRAGIVGWAKAENIRRAHEALARVDLDDLASQDVNELSGGQLQRVLIARALVSDPVALLLDEPTASIDQYSQTHLKDFLMDVNQQVAVVVVTHDVSVFSEGFKSVACVNRRVYHHTAGELASSSLENVYGCPVELFGHGLPHRVLKGHS